MSERGHRRRAATVAVAVTLGVAAAVVLLAGPGQRRPGATRSTPAPSTTSSTTVSAQSTSAAPAPALAAPAGQQFGANVNLLLDPPGVPDSLIVTQLRALAATGATLARSDALWEASEPNAPVAGVHRYDWGFDDRVASRLAQAGLQWLPVLDYSVAWAQSIPGQDHSPPRSAADYAAYAGAFAARYGPGGGFWAAHPELSAKPVTTIEIWNEPDNGEFWTPTPNAGAYADMYAAARLAIDAAAPAVRVIVGGLTRPTQFLPAMLAARPSLAGHIDGVAVHPYGTPPVVSAKLEADRAMLTTVGLAAVPLYVTEFGWTTSPPGALDYVPAAARPGYVRRVLNQLGGSPCGVADAVLYTWYSPQQDPADSQQWYGIDPPTSTPSADTGAFTAGVHGAAAARAQSGPCG